MKSVWNEERERERHPTGGRAVWTLSTRKGCSRMWKPQINNIDQRLNESGKQKGRWKIKGSSEGDVKQNNFVNGTHNVIYE